MHRVTKSTVKAYVLMGVGTFLVALAFNLFFIENDIAPGGLSGVGTMIYHLWGFPVGLTTAVLNIPLFLISFRSVGRTFALRSFISMLALSLFIDILPQYNLTPDMLLAAIYGGLTMGLGLGLVIRGGATTGGTDLAAMLVHRRFPHLSVGMMLFTIDCMVVVASGFVFDTMAAMYALLSVIIASKVADMVVQGLGTSMQFFIISDRAPQIAKRITSQIDRGATLIEAVGAYTGERRGMLYCVVGRTEVTHIKEIVAHEDPRAFVTLSVVREAMGEGFSDLKVSHKRVTQQSPRARRSSQRWQQ